MGGQDLSRRLKIAGPDGLGQFRLGGFGIAAYFAFIRLEVSVVKVKVDLAGAEKHGWN
jgi:hypothetical protein